MYLRATVGPHAGEVRNFEPNAARAALQAGTAEHLDAIVGPPEVAREAPSRVAEMARVKRTKR